MLDPLRQLPVPAESRAPTRLAVASTVLMLVTVYEWQWMPSQMPDTVRLDPTRMAQGIMTGIGFLGAGVIFKEGITVRGLTTAASIWTTAALGILIGIGFHFPATVTVLLVIFVLSAFHWVETKIPAEDYARLDVTFARDQPMDEEVLRAERAERGFTVAPMNYRLGQDGAGFEYRMMIRTTQAGRFGALARALSANPRVFGFRIARSGD